MKQRKQPVYFQYIQGRFQNEVHLVRGAERIPDGRIVYTLDNGDVVIDEAIYPNATIGSGEQFVQGENGEVTIVRVNKPAGKLIGYKVIQVPSPHQKYYEFISVDENGNYPTIDRVSKEGEIIASTTNPNYNPNRISSITHRIHTPIPNEFNTSYEDMDYDEEFDEEDYNTEEGSVDLSEPQQVATQPEMVITPPKPIEAYALDENYQTQRVQVSFDEESKPTKEEDMNLDDQLLVRIVEKAKKTECDLSFNFTLSLPSRSVVDIIKASLDSPEAYIERMCHMLVDAVPKDVIVEKLYEIIADSYKPEKKIVRIDEVEKPKAKSVKKTKDSSLTKIEPAVKPYISSHGLPPELDESIPFKNLTPEQQKARRCLILERARAASKKNREARKKDLISAL